MYVEAQAGFRKHTGTVDNAFVLHGLITHLLNKIKKYMRLLLTLLKHSIM